MESLNVLGHGLRARALSAIDGLGEPLRARVAEFALISGATISLIMLMFGELGWPGGSRGLPDLDRPFPLQSGGESYPPLWAGRLGPFESVGALVYTGWLAMALFAVLGKTAALRVAAMATLAATLVVPQLKELTGASLPPQSVLLGLAMLAALVLLTPARPASRALRVGGALFVAAASCGYGAYYLGVVSAGSHASLAQSRACFYWCPRLPNPSNQAPDSSEVAGYLGRGGAATLAGLATPLLLALAVLGLARWRWDRTCLAATAVIALPWLAIGSRNRYWGWSYSDWGIHNRDQWGNSFGPTPRVIGLTLAVWLLAVAAGIALTNSRRTRLLPEPFRQAAR